MKKARKAFLRDDRFRSEHTGPPPDFELSEDATRPQNLEPLKSNPTTQPHKSTPEPPTGIKTEVKTETPEEPTVEACQDPIPEPMPEPNPTATPEAGPKLSREEKNLKGSLKVEGVPGKRESRNSRGERNG